MLKDRIEQFEGRVNSVSCLDPAEKSLSRRNDILQVALTEFVADSFEVTLNQIARRAKVSRSAIIYHFINKRRLISECIGHARYILHQYVFVSDTTDFIFAYQNLIQGINALLEEQPAVIKLLFTISRSTHFLNLNDAELLYVGSWRKFLFRLFLLKTTDKNKANKMAEKAFFYFIGAVLIKQLMSEPYDLIELLKNACISEEEVC